MKCILEHFVNIDQKTLFRTGVLCGIMCRFKSPAVKGRAAGGGKKSPKVKLLS